MNPAIASHLWQSTWFAVAAGLLTLLFQRNRARVRFALWLCASIKFLVPFAPLIDAARQIAPPAPPPAIAERLAITLAEPAGFVAAAAAPLSQPRTEWLAAALVSLWAGGLVTIAFVRLRGWRRVRAALRASRAVDIEAAVPVRTTAGLLEPGVVGVLRPVLLIPDGIADRLTPAQLASVLAHELCHVRRRDNLAAAIHMSVEALFWCHPLVWWVGARMVEERERACDEGVLSLGSTPKDYAEAILGVCKLYAESPLACVSGVTGASLKKRIEAIMNQQMGERLSLAKKLLLTSAGAAAVVVPALLGILIGAGHVPVLHAQQIPPPAPPARIAQTTQTTQGRGRVTPPTPPEPAAGRLIAVLFNNGAMTPDDLALARGAAGKFMETQLREGATMSIMLAAQGKVTVLQDFTADPGALESAIARATAASEPDSSSGAAVLEQAALMLGAIRGKKALMYFAGGSFGQLNDDAAIPRAVQAAVAANVAFYPIDKRGVPVSVASVVYTGAPENSSPLVQALEASGGGAPSTAVIAGLPSRHAELRMAPAVFGQTLVVPLDGLSGKIDIVAEVRWLTGFGEGGVAANLRDYVNIRESGPTAQYNSRFTLTAGSYVAKVLVREQSTGRMFAETISFQVE